MFSPDEGHVNAIKKLGLKNTVAWRQFVDIEFWHHQILEPKVKNEGIKIFQPTAQQWADMPKSASKANEVLFMGFKIFLQNGIILIFAEGVCVEPISGRYPPKPDRPLACTPPGIEPQKCEPVPPAPPIRSRPLPRERPRGPRY